MNYLTPLWEGLGHQASHITFDLQSVLPVGYAGVRVALVWDSPLYAVNMFS